MVPPDPPLSCKEGCNWCCSLVVEVTVVEVFALARYLRLTRPPEEIAILVERIGDILKARAQGQSPYCALLQDGRCSIYDRRPLSCFGWNSYDAAPCQAYAEGDKSSLTPCDINLKVIADAVTYGLLEGVALRGLSGKCVELMAALRTVLLDPGVEARWLQGDTQGFIALEVTWPQACPGLPIARES